MVATVLTAGVGLGLLAQLSDRITPLLIAVLIGHLLAVCLHEFLHAYVAYLGGDRSEWNRRQLVDPRTYIHPVTSLLIPAAFVFMGGLPLVGGAVFIDRAALRSRTWGVAVDLAGVVGNFVVFLILALIFVLLPDQPAGMVLQNAKHFCGSLAFLQLFLVLLNLTPLPPLDGFNALSNFMSEEQRAQFHQPWVPFAGLVLLFVVLNYYPPLMDFYFETMIRISLLFGIPIDQLYESYVWVIYNERI